jgi:hypothetical protein
MARASIVRSQYGALLFVFALHLIPIKNLAEGQIPRFFTIGQICCANGSDSETLPSLSGYVLSYVAEKV